MTEILGADFPPWLHDEFEKMVIPGRENGFAITFTSGNKKRCVACGRICNEAATVYYHGDEYTPKRKKAISLDTFNKLCQALPTDVRKDGVMFADDILDGEVYFVKWSSGKEETRLVLANPREIDNDNIKAVARRLDELMKHF